MKVETSALSIKHIAEMYYVNGKHFADLYRNKISGYADWCASELCCGFYFNVANIGARMSLDETCLSNGEVWTWRIVKKLCLGIEVAKAEALVERRSKKLIILLLSAKNF